MPKKVAIPGGTGTIGSCIIAALASNPLYTPIVLSRSTPTRPPNTSSLSESGIETRYVIYTSLPSITTALSDIYAVISALLIPGPEFVSSQLNLLSAAIQAGCTRFAPSEFALRQDVHSRVDIDHAKIVVWDAVKQAVEEGKIDAAAFPCGMFMNYLAVGAPREIEGRAGFKEGPLIFYLSKGSEDGGGGWIEVPLTETGAYPKLTMTDIRDVGRFVVAALGMDEPWAGRELGMSGDTRSFSEVIEIIGRVLGREVRVRTVDRSTLQKRLDTVKEGDILGQIDIQYTMVCGEGGSVVKGVLNELCPGVRPTSIQEFMERYWGVVKDLSAHSKLSGAMSRVSSASG